MDGCGSVWLSRRDGEVEGAGMEGYMQTAGSSGKWVAL